MHNNKQMNPIIPLVIVVGLLFVAFLYYKTPLFKGGAEEEPVAAATPEPTITPVATNKPEITTLTVEEVESILKPAAELITSKYYYKNAADFDSVLTWFDDKVQLPWTHSTGYIIYNGVVNIGVDFGAITFDIDNKKRTILVHLPKEKILSHEIDESSVVSNTQESIFNNLDAQYYATLIAGFKKTTESEVLGNKEYMNQVRSNTEHVIRSFLLTSELTGKYKVEFDHK